jgi:hypothetical protein
LECLKKTDGCERLYITGLEAGHQKYFVVTELPPVFREEFQQ